MAFKGVIIYPEVKVGESGEFWGERIERLLFSRQFGTLGHVTWGSFIPELFYEQSSLSLARDVLRDLEDLLKDNEPDLDLVSISVTIVAKTAETPNDGIIITVDFTTKDQPQVTKTLNFFKIKEV